MKIEKSQVPYSTSVYRQSDVSPWDSFVLLVFEVPIPPPGIVQLPVMRVHEPDLFWTFLNIHVTYMIYIYIYYQEILMS